MTMLITKSPTRLRPAMPLWRLDATTLLDEIAPWLALAGLALMYPVFFLAILF